MIEFDLFRVKVFQNQQRQLFEDATFSPQLALLAAIQKTPSIEIRKGYTWHIGNVEKVDDFGMYFALGRTTKTTRSLYDEAEHKFIEVDEESAPFTHVLCDTAREVFGIARESDLAPTSSSIARQLEALLNFTAPKSSNNSTAYRFEIGAIRDPKDFLEQIRTAYAVTRFAVTFTPPNAFDPSELQKPVEEYAKVVNARRGLLQVSGPALDKETVVEVTRSGAASGSDVNVSIRTSKNARPMRRNLQGNPASVPIKESADVTTDKQKRSVLGDIRELYESIRRGITRS